MIDNQESKHIGDVKEAVFKAIEDYPGLSLRELSRELKISSSLAKYHLDKLLEEQKIISFRDNKAIRFFLADLNISHEDLRVLTLLRNPVILEFIVLFLESRDQNIKSPEDGLLRNSDLYNKLRFNSKGTISYYLKKLQEEKILSKGNQPNSYYLTCPDKIKTILKLYKPNPSIIEKFIRLWTSFYSRIEMK